MNIGGYNNFIGNKGAKINKQLLILKSIYETNKDISFNIFNLNLDDQLKTLDSIVTCGERKIIFSEKHNHNFELIKSSQIPHLIRDVTYLRMIPKIAGEDVGEYPRFTWGKITPSVSNFPYDKTYDRWSYLSKKYGLSVREYSNKGENILFLLQVPTDASLNKIIFNGDNYLNFVSKSLIKILKHTDRKIVLRGHPLFKDNNKLIEFFLYHFRNSKKVFSSKNIELRDDLFNARCVVSYNSSATVEALINGVNVINLSPDQPCFSANNKIEDIESLKNIDRENFLRKISYLHWSNKELESFENRKYLCKLLIKSMNNLN